MTGRLGIGFQRHRVAEITQHAVAHVVGDETLVRLDLGPAQRAEFVDQFERRFRIVTFDQPGRIDQVAEQVGE